MSLYSGHVVLHSERKLEMESYRDFGILRLLVESGSSTTIQINEILLIYGAQSRRIKSNKSFVPIKTKLPPFPDRGASPLSSLVRSSTDAAI